MGDELGPEFERGIMGSAGARLSSWDSSCRLSNCTAVEVGRSRNLTQLRKWRQRSVVGWVAGVNPAARRSVRLRRHERYPADRAPADRPIRRRLASGSAVDPLGAILCAL